MAVNLNPNVSFTSYRISDDLVNKAREQAKAENNTLLLNVLDQCEFEGNKDQTEKQAKKPSAFKRGIAGIAKFYTAMSEITKGIFKGTVYGSMTGIGIMSAGWLFGALPNGFKKGGSLIETFKHPIKSVGKPAKITAAICSIGVAAYHIVRGKLHANQRNAFVDQKLNIQKY